MLTARNKNQPDDPRNWDSASLCAALGFENSSRLTATLRAIKSRGYYSFPRRSNGKTRVITAPHEWLKEIQRRTTSRVLQRLPVSNAAYCRPGRGVVDGARIHLGNPHLAILDIKDCFPSTTVRMVLGGFLVLGLDENVARILTRLTTHDGILPQGPPSSPSVLNCVLREVDEALITEASRHGAIYTRYMDDLAFSGQVPVRQLARNAAAILRRAGYQISSKKRRVWGPDDPHTITGIVLSSTMAPTEEFLKALKRAILDHTARGSHLSEAQIRGKIEWVRQLDQQMGQRLQSQLAVAR